MRTILLRIGVMSLLSIGAPMVNADEEQTLAPESKKPTHSELTEKAWAALDKQEYAEALSHAKSCIEIYGEAAAKLQKKLKADGVELPTGAVTEEAKKAIHKNGSLNDVAACQIIAYQAGEALGKKEIAQAAAQAAKKLPHARVWDPQGWFWSPAEAAEKSLAEEKSKD